MFKFQSTVRIFVVIVMFFGHAVHAEDTKPVTTTVTTQAPGTLSDKQLEFYIKQEAVVCDKTNKATYNASKCATVMAALYPGSKSAQSVGCDGDYENAFQESITKFDTDCREANISISGEGGNISCGMAMARCKCMDPDLSSSDKAKFQCNDGDVVRSSSKKNTAGGIDKSYASRMFAYCPGMAAAGYEKTVEKLDKAGEKLDKLEEKLPDLKEKALSAASDARKDAENLKKEMDEKQDATEQEIEAARKEKEEAVKGIEDQIGQIDQQMRNLDAQIEEIDNTVKAADAARARTIEQANLNCVATARTQVMEEMNQTKTELLTGTHKISGGQKGLFGRIGKSDKQWWNTKMAEYFSNCSNDPGATATKKEAGINYNLIVEKAAKDKSRVRKDIQALAQKKLSMKNPGGACGMAVQNADGSSNETAMCQAARKGAEKEYRLTMKMYRDDSTYRSKIAAADQEGRQKAMAAAESYDKANKTMENEKLRRDNLQWWVDKADQKGVSAASKDKFDKVKTSFGELKSNANKAVTCALNNGDTDCKGEACSKARAFYKLVTNVDPVPHSLKMDIIESSTEVRATASETTVDPNAEH